MALARRSIKQRFHPDAKLLAQMECFRQMTNDCIRIGLEFEKKTAGTNSCRTPSMKKLSLMSYGELRKRYGGYSGYALCAISRAAGILSARRKSMKRGIRSGNPYVSKLGLVSCYGFKLEDGNLIIRVDAEILESMDCPRCGERLQVPIQGDEGHYRQLWCEVCERWRDRDLVAVLNISRRGWSRFDHSSKKEGEAGETVKGNAEHDGDPLVLRVDASKLRHVQETQ